VGCITPWNYPLLQLAAKVAFAMGAGCTVVLKPSAVAPLDAFVLAEVIDAVGLPPGVFNLVAGTGPGVGEPLAAHPGVAMVSFTGSTRAGTRVAALCAPNVTRVALELGGKSASVLLDDLDGPALAEAVEGTVLGAFTNSGQTCSATTRMLVPAGQLDDVVDMARDVAESLRVGDPSDPTTDLGPLASAAQWDRVQGHLRAGIDEGARLVTGGPGRPNGLERGWFARPTVFADVTPDMHVAREEIFGPVLSVLAHRDLDHAVALANDTDYGLSGAVWSADRDRARSVALRLRTGEVDLNGGADWHPSQPFGGFGRSGRGREYGVEGFEEFLETTTIR
jgi:acyl-CoA reductase-like NAD-dependent aldehyde dehydrogenase